MSKQIVKKNKSVYVALSGGVDSAVSAALLQQQGFAVTGVFMKNWSGDNFGLQADCPWEQDQKDAEAVCQKLGIPFKSYNFEKQYREQVVAYFFKEFTAGRTPNPDVMCNKEIKFGIFMERAWQDGADYIATGHYAQNIFNTSTQSYELHKGVDNKKDQTYFIYNLDQSQLSRTFFPVGGYQKTQVRELANKFGLPVATKADSQGICFIGEINVQDFLRKNISPHLGKIVDIDNGQAVGMHDGIEFYTIGQREGLKIGGSKEPYYVCAKDKQHNIVYVANGKNNPQLFKTEVRFSDVHWINSDFQNLDITAAIRYRQKPAAGKLDLKQNKFSFEQPQRAIAEGQSIVFYQGSKCLGGAIINQ